MSDTLTLTRRDCRYYPAAERDIDHTSYEVARTTLTFTDRHDAIEYLTWELSMSNDRARLVLDRRCPFQALEWGVDPDADPLAFTVYQFDREGRVGD